jgi:arylsulfatase A
MQQKNSDVPARATAVTAVAAGGSWQGQIGAGFRGACLHMLLPKAAEAWHRSRPLTKGVGASTLVWFARFFLKEFAVNLTSPSRRSVAKVLVACVATLFLPGRVMADAPPPSTAARPNVIFLLADDLGYGDIGCYGQKKIHTPNIDRLAAEGMRMMVHYSGNAVCAPSRCVLLTGLHPGHTYIRDNMEFPGGEGQAPVPTNSLTLPLTLKKLGYTTGCFGKWGLGPVGSTGDPQKQGIDHFYGYNCQRQAHNYYPTHLWDNDQKVPLDNPAFSPGQKLPAGADPNDPASYARYRGKEYAPDLISVQALKFIGDNKDKPFFLYYATTVPHLALQVPEDSLKEYEGMPDEPYVGNRAYLPNRTPHATYAAMITRMDREIGRMLAKVHELGMDDRTIFIFTSDNGPLYDKLGGTDTEFFQSDGIFRGRKGAMYEGGLRMPCIVTWKGHIAAGTDNNRVTGFEDWLPTLLELAGQKDATPTGLDGISFAPTLLGQTQEPRPFLYRESPGYDGQQAIRVGNWKAVRVNLETAKPGAVELYDLEKDPAESTDVAALHPDLVAKLSELMRQQHVKSAEFPIRGLDNPS